MISSTLLAHFTYILAHKSLAYSLRDAMRRLGWFFKLYFLVNTQALSVCMIAPTYLLGCNVVACLATIGSVCISIL